MMRALGQVLGVACLVASSGAVAQVAYKAPKADPLAIAVMSEFARCVADSDPAGAHRILDSDYHVPGYGAGVRAFAVSHKRCLLGGQLRFNQIVLIGGMAEELNRKAGVTAENLRSRSAADTAATPERCLIRKQPEAVSALFSKKPASRDEAAAIDGLRSSYADCLPAAELPVLNVVALRSRLAIAAYRLVNMQPVRG